MTQRIGKAQCKLLGTQFYPLSVSREFTTPSGTHLQVQTKKERRGNSLSHVHEVQSVQFSQRPEPRGHHACWRLRPHRGAPAARRSRLSHGLSVPPPRSPCCHRLDAADRALAKSRGRVATGEAVSWESPFPDFSWDFEHRPSPACDLGRTGRRGPRPADHRPVLPGSRGEEGGVGDE